MPDEDLQNDLEEELDYDHSRGWHLYLVTKNTDLLEGCNRVLHKCFLPEETRTPKKLGAARKVVRRLVMALYKEWENDPTRFITISLNNNDWVAKGRYGRLGLSCGLIRKTLQKMEEEKLIHFHRGDITWNAEDRKQTRVRAKPKLIELMLQTRTQGDTVKERIKTDKKRYLVEGFRPRTILKDENKKSIKVARVSASVKRGEELLEKYQAVLDQTKIVNPVTSEEIQPYDKFQYRTFARRRLDLNGRVIGGFWQRIGKEKRALITLDDQPTVELDLKGAFPVIVYHFLEIDFWSQYVGIPQAEMYKADPYYLEGYTDSQPFGSVFRKALKNVFNSAINVDVQTRSVRKVSGILEAKLTQWVKDREITQAEANAINGVRASMIRKFLFERHAPISDYFFKPEIGLLAMNAESRVAMKVIEEFTNLNKPILTIYDSFVVKREDKVLLGEAIVNNYYQIFGLTPAFS